LDALIKLKQLLLELACILSGISQTLQFADIPNDVLLLTYHEVCDNCKRTQRKQTHRDEVAEYLGKEVR
jgi:hypothetical protein